MSSDFAYKWSWRSFHKCQEPCQGPLKDGCNILGWMNSIQSQLQIGSSTTQSVCYCYFLGDDTPSTKHHSYNYCQECPCPGIQTKTAGVSLVRSLLSEMCRVNETGARSPSPGLFQLKEQQIRIQASPLTAPSLPPGFIKLGVFKGCKAMNFPSAASSAN